MAVAATIGAAVFTVCVAIVVAFQLCLAAGKPWGDMAMGGKYPGVLPKNVRVAVAVQAALLVLLAVCVLARAGALVDEASAGDGGWVVGAWCAVGLSAVSTLMNCITPSKRERNTWAPVALVMLASSLVVALDG